MVIVSKTTFLLVSDTCGCCVSTIVHVLCHILEEISIVFSTYAKKEYLFLNLEFHSAGCEKKLKII